MPIVSNKKQVKKPIEDIDEYLGEIKKIETIEEIKPKPKPKIKTKKLEKIEVEEDEEEKNEDKMTNYKNKKVLQLYNLKQKGVEKIEVIIHFDNSS